MRKSYLSQENNVEPLFCMIYLADYYLKGCIKGRKCKITLSGRNHQDGSWSPFVQIVPFETLRLGPYPGGPSILCISHARVTSWCLAGKYFLSQLFMIYMSMDIDYVQPMRSQRRTVYEV